MKYDNQKILITNHFLKEFSGSEIAVYDVAKEFITLGFKVTLGSFTFVSPLKDLFDELDCNFIDLNKIDDSYDDKFDIIWAQHFTTIDKILLETKISSNFIIYSSLSPYEALESPPLSSQKINLFLANSFETRDKLLDMGLSSESIYILPNPVSDDFFRININSLDKLERIAIVSNHIPDEIRKAISYLKNDNIDVVLYGIEGVFELITPNILEQYDAVITIGRTVQYCLSMGIPVYCYDRFGGCGWITSTNIEEASKFNFSGRCTNRKLNVNEIIKEIKENFNIAKSNIDSNRKFAEENYKLKYHLSYILNYINSSSVNYNIDFFRNVALRQKKYIEHLIKSNFFIQLFVSQDTHFTEESSIKYPVLQITEIQRFEFDLKDFGNIKNLRLDPLNDSCVVNISKIYLVLEDDLQIDLKLNIQANASSHHGDSYFFEFLDPQIYFEDVDFENLSIKKFVIELLYNHIAKDAVHICANQITVDKNYMIETKEQIIQNQNQELETKERIIQEKLLDIEIIKDMRGFFGNSTISFFISFVNSGSINVYLIPDKSSISNL